MFLETKSPKNMNPPNGGAYSKPIMRRLCGGGGGGKKTSKFNLWGSWMVVFDFLVCLIWRVPIPYAKFTLEYGFGAPMWL